MASCDNNPVTTTFSEKIETYSKNETSEWINCLDKKPEYRTSEDVRIIYDYVKTIKSLQHFPPYFLQQMCTMIGYESLRSGVVLYFQGNPAVNWYTVLSGSLQEAVFSVVPTQEQSVGDMCCANLDWEMQEAREKVERGGHCQRLENRGEEKRQEHSSYCTLLTNGSVFGESLAADCRRKNTVVTVEECQLLFMDQRDFRALWRENQDFFQDLHISSRENNLLLCSEVSRDKSIDDGLPFSTYPAFITGENDGVYKSHWSSVSPTPPPSPNKTNESVLHRGASISQPEESEKRPLNEDILNFGAIILKTIRSLSPKLINPKNSQVSCGYMIGSEMVSWMCTQIQMDDRQLSLGIWQVLLEEGVVVSFHKGIEMRDDFQYYCFHEEVYPRLAAVLSQTKGNLDCKEYSIQSVIASLRKTSPDSLFRMILRKDSKDRLPGEIDFVFGELLHIQALSHLSTNVKRQLAGVLIFEAHSKSGKALFRQGDEGTSWYIILKGSVHVHIQGKGVVCTLHEGDDFGKLALVNNAPRAATIVLRENNCHFLRVDKEDFNRILRDVEANTVRLKEHGADVLILEKISAIKDNNLSAKCLYSVRAGSPEKILEHMLETRLDINEDFITILTNTKTAPDAFVEDFILTHPIFISSFALCNLLLSYLQMENRNSSNNEKDSSPPLDYEPNEMIRNKRRRVIYFLFWWYRLSNIAFTEDNAIQAFTDDFKAMLQNDCKRSPSNKTEVEALDSLLYTSSQDQRDTNKRLSRRNRMSFKAPSSPKSSIQIAERPPLRFGDTTVINIFTTNSESVSLKLPLGSTAFEIIESFANQKGHSVEGLSLVELRSTGEKVVFKEKDIGITTNISVNGRLFIVSVDEVNGLNPLQDQLLCPESSLNFLEIVKIDDLALQITIYDWELFQNVHVYELIYQAFGRVNFQKITGNLDLVIREFSVIQFWVVTELCLIPTLNKRVTILKRLIKLAAKLLNLKNMNSFFAVMLGLSNSAISRLHLTWDKLPNKYSKLFTDLSSMLDPSRNHRVFRQTLDKTQPPIIPFLALLLKDMTFTHEGNKTRLDNLVNFEKMELIARNLRVLIHCRSKPLHLEGSVSRERAFAEIKSYVRQLRCIDDQKVLTNMSKKLEPRKTAT